VSTPPAPGALATQAATGPADKVRFRFAKSGPLRWLSHHDLMRTFERVLRRAELPFRRTQGFNPHPRLIFALSMPLGVEGHAEVAELELDEVLPPDDVLDRLRRQCPPGLQVLELTRVPPRATAQVRGLTYALELPADRAELARSRIAELLASTELWIDRRRPSGGANSRRMDLRPFLRDLRVTGDDPARLEMDLWLTPAGTARPEEVLGLLGLQDLAEAGAVLHRLRLELREDTTPERGQETGARSQGSGVRSQESEGCEDGDGLSSLPADS
jgi:radical SAM-linked protein